MNSVLPFFYNNGVVVVHMAAKLLYIFQLPFQLGVAMWNVRSGVCHLQLWDFRHLDMHVLAFSFPLAGTHQLNLCMQTSITSWVSE